MAARGWKKERVEDSEVSSRPGFGKTPLRKTTLALNSGGERNAALSQLQKMTIRREE